MPTFKLSDNKVRAAKPTDKPQKIFDGQGLHLFVSPKGAKTWRLAYRLDGKPQTASLGAYPDVSLALAREKAAEIRKGMAQGVSPKKPKRNAVTFKEAAEIYWNGRKDVADGYRANALRALEMHLYKPIGDLPIGSIDRPTLLTALMITDNAGHHVYVRKVRMWASQVWDWAVEHEHAAINIPATIQPKKAFGKSKTKPHASLELTEVADFLLRLSLEKEIQSVLACKLMALTWVRTQELRMMLWDQIDGNVWRLPEEVMKRDKDHIVPLARQAVEIIEKLRARSRGSIYVFPNDRRADRPMSENAVLYLMHRMGYKGEMTGHGWRSVASTWANEHGYNRDAIERQLAHTPDDKVRSAYNRAEYLKERRAMMQAFADWLDKPDTSSLQG
ncbi:tyrosine-type recombinase/integrase [Variovorax boronicumulans]|uniref:tyrosine-type recombinase/integrase n=1 Tax=Variovorax boronicumulans TaxID=436515 RepID=UPI001C57F362